MLQLAFGHAGVVLQLHGFELLSAAALAAHAANENRGGRVVFLVRPLLQLSQWLESVAAERHIDGDAAGHGVSHH